MRRRGSRLWDRVRVLFIPSHFVIEIRFREGRGAVFTTSCPLLPGDRIEITFAAGSTREAVVTFKRNEKVSCVLNKALRNEAGFMLELAQARLLARRTGDWSTWH